MAGKCWFLDHRGSKERYRAIRRHRQNIRGKIRIRFGHAIRECPGKLLSVKNYGSVWRHPQSAYCLRINALGEIVTNGGALPRGRGQTV